MKLLASLDLHVGNIGAHHPLPVTEHFGHGPGNLSIPGDDLLPSGRERSTATLLAKEIEQGMGNEEAAHVGVGKCMLEGILNVAKVGVAGLTRGLLSVGAKIRVEGVDGSVLDAHNLDLSAKNVQANVVADGNVLAVGGVEAEDTSSTRVGKGRAVQPADE